MATTDDRFRLSLTSSQAGALQQYLNSNPELPPALYEVRGKLDIFIAKIMQGQRKASYSPVGISAVHAVAPVSASLYKTLMDSPETSAEIKNKLFAFTMQHNREPNEAECTKITGLVISVMDAIDMSDTTAKEMRKLSGPIADMLNEDSI